MLFKYHYTDKEKEQIIKSMVILVDSREKQEHILEYFDKKKINYKIKKLDYGDYSIRIPANEELHIFRDIDFSKDVIIERKNSLEELSGNLTKDRSRIEKEFALAPKTKVLLIENASYDNIAKGEYDTQYNRKSFLGTLHSWMFKYDIPFMFMPDNSWSGLFIRLYFEYWLKSQLN